MPALNLHATHLDQALDLVRAVGQLLEPELLGFPGFGVRGFDHELVLDHGVGVRVLRTAGGGEQLGDALPLRELGWVRLVSRDA